MGKQIVLVGATRLVGLGVLEVLLQATDIDGVSVLARRAVAGPQPAGMSG